MSEHSGAAAPEKCSCPFFFRPKTRHPKRQHKNTTPPPTYLITIARRTSKDDRGEGRPIAPRRKNTSPEPKLDPRNTPHAFRHMPMSLWPHAYVTTCDMPMSPPRDAHVTSARCPCRHRSMPMSPPRDAYVAAARCLCRRRAMPMSPPRDAHVTSATCLCHLRHMPMSPPRDAYLTFATCLCHHRAMPMSPSPHAHVAVARCLSHRRHMPMSLWRHAYLTLARCLCHHLRHAYLTLARCLCHHLRHAYVAEVRCLCRQSDMGMSPAPHPRCLVGWCGGRNSALALQVCFPCLLGCLASACRRHVHVGRVFFRIGRDWAVPARKKKSPCCFPTAGGAP